VILQKPPRRYTVRTQAQLVFALTALHNFMNSHGCDPEAESIDEDEEDDDQEAVSGHEAGMNTRRDNIAQLMWEDYRAYVRT